MPRFIAVHTIPDYNEENWIEMAKEYAGWISKFPHGVSYNLTYCGFPVKLWNVARMAFED